MQLCYKNVGTNAYCPSKYGWDESLMAIWEQDKQNFKKNYTQKWQKNLLQNLIFVE